MSPTTDLLIPSVETIAGIATARLVPFAVYGALAHRRLGASRLLAVMGVLGVCAFGARSVLPGLIVSAAWTLSYFGFAACLSHAARRWVASAQIGRGTLFLGGFAVYLVLPALLAPPMLTVAVVVFGWELTLSAFSYSVETARVQSTLGDALFFLLVNPVLVYPERGKRMEDGRSIGRGLARIALGVGAIASNYAMLLLLTTLVKQGTLSGEPHFFVASDAVRFSAYYAGQCLGLYFIHSGVASLQIGSMSVLGWRIPERYEYPFLACSPAQFWRRWNTYIGSWVRRYVFFPAVTHLRRRGGMRPALATVTGVFVAFGAMGFLHDWVPYLSRLRQHHGFVPGMTAIFLAHGTALLLFEGATRVVRGFIAERNFVPGRYAARAGLGVSWLTLRLINQSLAWAAIPVLSRGELPGSLVRFVRGVMP